MAWYSPAYAAMPSGDAGSMLHGFPASADEFTSWNDARPRPSKLAVMPSSSPFVRDAASPSVAGSVRLAKWAITARLAAAEYASSECSIPGSPVFDLE